MVLQASLVLVTPRILRNTSSTIFKSTVPTASFSSSLSQSSIPSQNLHNTFRIRSEILAKTRPKATAKMATRTGVAQQKIEEEPMEAESRKDADFLKVEALLFEKLTMAGVSSFSPTALLKIPGAIIQMLFGWLGTRNPLVRHAHAGHEIAWILDNTAYRSKDSAKWHAEMVVCLFQHGRGDITRATAAVADAIGLDGKVGASQKSMKLIESRLRPFVDAVAPSLTLPIVINTQDGESLKYLMGPSSTSGIAVQTLEHEHPGQLDGTANEIETDISVPNVPVAKGVTRLAVPEGFGIISDIDDTIKITQTPDPIGILKTTFAEPAQFTSHMPDFYKLLDQQLHKPCWFYLSASPYNLYPFLHKFLEEYYPLGTMILRDASWQTLGGLLGSLTQGVKAYKSSRIEKIHEWLPDRKFICIGDSTQMDPETYAAMYKKFPGWISAIYIRKVLDAPFMEKKNKPERFEKAFEGVPANVWKVFVLPDELVDHISTVAHEANLSVMDNFSCFSCGQDRGAQQLEKDRISLDACKY